MFFFKTTFTLFFLSTSVAYAQFSIQEEKESAFLAMRAERVETEFHFIDRISYDVAPGDTLGRIAREYGVSISDLRRWNNLRGDQIIVGQTLIIRVRGGSGDRVREEYTVRSGDNGGAIARRHGVSLRQLRRWNPDANLDRIRVGQTLIIYSSGGSGSDGSDGSGGSERVGNSRATGRPDRGRLSGGVQLTESLGYQIRNPERSYGTQNTILAIQNGFARVAAHYIELPEVMVSDLSRERGGRLGGHLSHQNGLDADISYYQHNCPENVCPFEEISSEELDVERQWYLFSIWIDQGLVQYIFIDNHLQIPLYEYALARGATNEQLAEWFQYPRRGAYGILRNERGHDDHFHVRFWPEPEEIEDE